MSLKLFHTASSRLLASALLFAGLAQGCGGAREVGLVTVEGVVTLNGLPLPDANVVFRPAKGRPSIGRTDGEGRYQLAFIEGRQGALPGQHKVSISTFVEPNSDSSDPLLQKGRPEQVPANYNTRTTLVADLSSDGNVVQDFTLESRGVPAKKGRPN